MKRWLVLTGGLLAWALHFVGVYFIASLGDVVNEADAPLWRWIGGGFSLICLGLALLTGLGAGLALRATEANPTDTFILRVAMVVSLIGAVSIGYQTLPLLL